MNPLLVKAGVAVGSKILGGLFSKDAPAPKTAADSISDFRQMLNGIAPTNFVSSQQDYGMIPGGVRNNNTTNAAWANNLEKFNTPQMSQDALNSNYDAYSQMAKTGFGSDEMRKLSNEEFSLANQRSAQQFKDSLGNLDSYMAARGMGQSGNAAGQVRELAQRSNLDLATLANQIATRNAETQRAYQMQGLQGVGATGNQAYTQAQNAFSTNQAAANQNFNQRLQAANQAQNFFNQNEALDQQTYQNAINARQLTDAQSQFLDRMALSDNQLRYGTASNLQNMNNTQSNMAYQNALNQTNEYNKGIGSMFGGMFANVPVNDTASVPDSSFINQLQNLDTTLPTATTSSMYNNTTVPNLYNGNTSNLFLPTMPAL